MMVCRNAVPIRGPVFTAAFPCPARLRVCVGFALLPAEELVPSAVRDVAELRDVDVDQRARMVVLVAADRFTSDPIDAAESG